MTNYKIERYKIGSMQNSRYSIFFDDGGVINDNASRGPQWSKLIAKFFIPKYGKTFEE
ncbi:MAG: hypothetical protein HeimC2_26550 [Candidatus Heimdallarchaeota archaeon LC_2]|nr:MAG: hypothetical protein HeimC2_26550 [Candidatus Heimdallarchaeota archaeon LC_2]